MEAKGLITIDRAQSKPYVARVSRDEVARLERNQLLQKVYNGAAGDLIAAFLKETPISSQEAARLRQLLDEMEV